MIMKMLAVFDRAAAAYGRPIFVNALGQGMRSFQDEINREAPDNTMYHHPDDYELWSLAEYDDSTGQIFNMKLEKLSDGSQAKLK